VILFLILFMCCVKCYLLAYIAPSLHLWNETNMTIMMYSPPLVSFCFSNWVILNIPGWPQTRDPRDSAFRVARNIGACHHSQNRKLYKELLTKIKDYLQIDLRGNQTLRFLQNLPKASWLQGYIKKRTVMLTSCHFVLISHGTSIGCLFYPLQLQLTLCQDLIPNLWHNVSYVITGSELSVVVSLSRGCQRDRRSKPWEGLSIRSPWREPWLGGGKRWREPAGNYFSFHSFYGHLWKA
jgi:hypothetical protein